MITRRIARPLSALSSRSWICPSCAQASQSRLQLSQPQKRAKHNVPPLNEYLEKAFQQDGVPGLFSRDAFRIGWTEYQQLLVDKLNQLTEGDQSYNEQTKNLVLKFARDPMNASLFNHASMAFNNHFFYKGLSTAPMHISDARVATLKGSLESTYGSMETLQATMLDTAAAMFGPGFVWLVFMHGHRMQNGWRVLTTYNAGTPFPDAGYRHQGIDMNTSTAETYDQYARQEPVNNLVGSFGKHSESGVAQAKLPPGAPLKVTPVLCVNTWEHVWLHDYGVRGKRRYLADWWNAVDWHTVMGLAPPDAPHMNPIGNVPDRTRNTRAFI